MKYLIIIASAALIAFAAGCGHEAEVSEAQYDTLAVTATRATLEAKPKMLELYGVVRAGKEATLTGRATGPVVAIHVGAGDTVRKGELLLELEERMSGGQLAQAQGALSQAQAAFSIAEKNYTRFQSLYDKQACSELELDMARMQFEQAKGAVEQAEGAVATASSVADEARLRAPFDAVIVQKMIDVGDLAAPGRPLMQVQSLSGREFVMQVRAADVDKITIGDSISVLLAAPAREVRGEITEVSGGADPATHSFTAKAILAEEDLRAGLTGRARVPGSEDRMVLLPASAIYRMGGLELVTIADENSQAQSRVVTVRPYEQELVEVVTGLEGGETIVINRSGPIAEGTYLKRN
jgi:RND family efflux transporter MFP subunit